MAKKQKIRLCVRLAINVNQDWEKVARMLCGQIGAVRSMSLRAVRNMDMEQAGAIAGQRPTRKPIENARKATFIA